MGCRWTRGSHHGCWCSNVIRTRGSFGTPRCSDDQLAQLRWSRRRWLIVGPVVHCISCLCHRSNIRCRAMQHRRWIRRCSFSHEGTCVSIHNYFVSWEYLRGQLTLIQGSKEYLMHKQGIYFYCVWGKWWNTSESVRQFSMELRHFVSECW